MGALPDINIAAFAVTLAIGSAGAWMTGRAIARVWRPWWIAALWMVPLTVAVRFFQATLFGGILLAPADAAAVLVVLALVAAAGHRHTRARQMVSRYGWLYRRAWPLRWRAVQSRDR
jgi:hypothetical protein